VILDRACTELSCPIHGPRNRELLAAERKLVAEARAAELAAETSLLDNGEENG
jgi:hypothetical protein